MTLGSVLSSVGLGLLFLGLLLVVWSTAPNRNSLLTSARLEDRRKLDALPGMQDEERGRGTDESGGKPVTRAHTNKGVQYKLDRPRMQRTNRWMESIQSGNKRQSYLTNNDQNQIQVQAPWNDRYYPKKNGYEPGYGGVGEQPFETESALLGNALPLNSRDNMFPGYFLGQNTEKKYPDQRPWYPQKIPPNYQGYNSKLDDFHEVKQKTTQKSGYFLSRTFGGAQGSQEFRSHDAALQTTKPWEDQTESKERQRTERIQEKTTPTNNSPSPLKQMTEFQAEFSASQKGNKQLGTHLIQQNIEDNQVDRTSNVPDNLNDLRQGTVQEYRNNQNSTKQSSFQYVDRQVLTSVQNNVSDPTQGLKNKSKSHGLQKDPTSQSNLPGRIRFSSYQRRTFHFPKNPSVNVRINPKVVPVNVDFWRLPHSYSKPENQAKEQNTETGGTEN